MTEEEQLATLVHLLEADVPELKSSLERDDCQLLCFVGRLINNYSAADRQDSNGVNHVMFRLAVRIALMRYAPYANTSGKQAEEFDERVFEWEKCLLQAFYNMQPHICSENAEMAWCIVGLLSRWSAQTKAKRITKIDELIGDLWIESLDHLLTHGEFIVLGENEAKLHSKTPDGLTPDSPESLMVKTITTILDGPESTSPDNEDWAHQFNTAVASCLSSYLENTNSPKVTQNILLKVMHRAQQKDSTSFALYGMVLQYLRLCLQRSFGDKTLERKHVPYQQTTDALYAYFARDEINSTTLSGVVFTAIKSFLFYGLIVLCNEPSDSSDSLAADNTLINRGEIYSLFLGMWQLLGPEWLYDTSSTASDAHGTESNTADWWHRSDFANKRDSSNQLGQTWQLCTLVRLAAGEFRLSMGRWMACLESKKSNEISILPEIVSCAQLVVQAVQLMTSLMDNEDEDMIGHTDEMGAVWTPDAILHIRQSLQDALNAAIQYFNENDLSDQTFHKSSKRLQNEREEIGRMCCLVLGTIAPELEFDQLLIRDDNKEHDPSSFVNALCTCVMFCGNVARTSADTKDHMSQLETDEPLSYILPCIMSIVDIVSTGCMEGDARTNASAHQVLKTLCSDGNLVPIISEFLIRLHTRFENSSEDLQPNIMSIAKLASIIGTGLVEIAEESSTKIDELSRTLIQWSKVFAT